MDSNSNMIKSLNIKIKILELENQKLLSTIEANNKEIEGIKTIIKSLSENSSTHLSETIPISHENLESKIIDLKFGWKINLNGHLTNDRKTVSKITGGSKWNCTAIGDKNLVKGKINKWKIQLTKINSSIVVGIVPKDINIVAEENWKKGYVTNCLNFDRHNLGVYQPFLNYEAKEGYIVEIIVNLENGELSFSVNGKDLGIFCNNIIKDIEYVPFIDIYNERNEITLLQ